MTEPDSTFHSAAPPDRKRAELSSSRIIMRKVCIAWLGFSTIFRFYRPYSSNAVSTFDMLILVTMGALLIALHRRLAYAIPSAVTIIAVESVSFILFLHSQRFQFLTPVPDILVSTTLIVLDLIVSLQLFIDDKSYSKRNSSQT
jgi:hypothetical protein